MGLVSSTLARSMHNERNTSLNQKLGNFHAFPIAQKYHDAPSGV